MTIGNGNGRDLQGTPDDAPPAPTTQVPGRDTYQAPTLGPPSALSDVTLFSGRISDGGVFGFGDEG